jgi:hypothetical protein
MIELLIAIGLIATITLGYFTVKDSHIVVEGINFVSVWHGMLNMLRISFVFNTIGLIATITLGYFFMKDSHIALIFLVIIGIWLIVARVANLLIKKAGTRRMMSAIGLSLNIAINLIMICLLTIFIYIDMEANYSFKNTDCLMQLLREGDRFAAYKLGERKVVAAIPLLSEIVNDETKDINLRLNAIKALGRICSSSVPRTEHHEAVIACLVEALKDKSKDGKHIRWTSAEALGEIGDKRAREPLRTAIENEADEFVRSMMIKELPRLVLSR